MLHEVREKFNIPDLRPGENIEDQIGPGEEVDWAAVRQEVEARLRDMPQILPKELAGFQRMIEFQKKMPRRAVIPLLTPNPAP